MDRVRTFNWVKNDGHGIFGWQAEDNPHFTPVLGFGLAHDVVEHMDNEQGMDAEMRAFGVLVYGRGCHGYFHDDAHLANSLASDLNSFYKDGAEDPSDIDEPLLLGEEGIDGIEIENHINNFLDAFESGMDEALIADPAWPQSRMDRVKENITGHMRRGVRMAHAAHGSSGNTFRAFQYVEDHLAVMGIASEYDREEFVEGDKLMVIVDPMMARISVDVRFLHSYDEEEFDEEAEEG